ncbi:hypothetical protein [Ideonella livida]|uniref:Uncharacterized protein n=1 Tax=Ideonella livida TaxID=2707176 RepID=A0A7C9TLR8_9BURK|nr:hypothetical protein [Ideonella livida]NDY93719.1 hypothetical protein [Ideonella livida]
MEERNASTLLGESRFGLPFPDSLHSAPPPAGTTPDALRALVKQVRAHFQTPALPEPCRDVRLLGRSPQALDSSRVWFAQQGFLSLGLYQRRQGPPLPGASTARPSVIDGHVSADGVVVGEYFQLRLPRLPLLARAVGATLTGDGEAARHRLDQARRSRHVLRLVTEFSDGSTVVTTNEPPHKPLDPPPGWDMHHEALHHPPSHLLGVHLQRLRAVRQQGGPSPVSMRDLDDLRAQALRWWQKSLSFREQVGWIQRDELPALLGLPPAEADALYPILRVLMHKDPRDPGHTTGLGPLTSS